MLYGGEGGRGVLILLRCIVGNTALGSIGWLNDTNIRGVSEQQFCTSRPTL